jgi:hypothetical protein
MVTAILAAPAMPIVKPLCAGGICHATTASALK